MQFASAVDAQFIRIISLFHAQRYVVHCLASKAFANLSAGDEFAFTTAERRRVDLERHADRGLIHNQRGQRLDSSWIADRFRDFGMLNTCKRDNVTRTS